MAYHIYISNAGSQFFSHFLMDEDSGALTAQPDIQLPGSPGAVATNPAGTTLWVALRSAGIIASYAVDIGNGQLSEIGKVSQEEGPPYLATDNTVSFLLSSYYGSGKIAVHRINDDGTLSAAPIQTLDTDGHAHSIQTDRSNRFAFVPHTNPANAIFQFRFAESTGMLEPNDPPKIQPATEEGPRHFAFHPHKNLLYSINENGCSVSAHYFDPDNGTLESFQVIPTQPEGTDMEGKSTAEIRITPDGKHLYGSNRGHDTLAHFTISDDGTLNIVDYYPTEAVPRFFELDPSARFAYSAGQNTGKLAAYAIDANSGALERIATYDVGESPLWITFIKQS